MKHASKNVSDSGILEMLANQYFSNIGFHFLPWKYLDWTDNKN